MKQLRIAATGTASSVNGQSFKKLYDFSKTLFLGVQAVIWRDVAIPGLAEHGTTDWVVIFGTGGGWRTADAYLAVVPLAQIQDKFAIRFLKAREENGRPQWSAQESDAMIIVDTEPPGEDENPDLANDQGCIGTFKAHYSDVLEAWIGAYDCAHEGIRLASAALPWGPWRIQESDDRMLFDPLFDGGFCGFMHAGPDYRAALGCSEAEDVIYGERKDEAYGTAYSPNIIKRYTVGNSEQATIYFSISAWHPYNDVLLKVPNLITPP